MNNVNFTTLFTTKGVTTERVTSKGDHCDFYRNLNKANMFSCRQRKGDLKSKVSGYANIFIIENPIFVVSEKSRQRVINTKRKNVHAFVRGDFHMALFDYELESTISALPCCTYNPYFEGHFFYKEDKTPVSESPSKYAILMGANVYLTDHLPNGLR